MVLVPTFAPVLCLRNGRQNVPLHQQVAEEIRRLILTGEWPASRRIPSEAALCEASQLSRNTIRQALQTLENEGLVIRRAGKGSFAAARAASLRPRASAAG